MRNMKTINKMCKRCASRQRKEKKNTENYNKSSLKEQNHL